MTNDRFFEKQLLSPTASLQSNAASASISSSSAVLNAGGDTTGAAMKYLKKITPKVKPKSELSYEEQLVLRRRHRERRQRVRR